MRIVFLIFIVYGLGEDAMIISASSRTDIPSYDSEWFFHRLDAGYVCTRGPMNLRQVSRIPTSGPVH